MTDHVDDGVHWLRADCVEMRRMEIRQITVAAGHNDIGVVVIMTVRGKTGFVLFT